MNTFTKITSIVGLGALLATSVLPVAAADVMTKPDTGLKPNKSIVVVDGTCMVTAVTKRDNAILAAMDAYSAAVHSALQTRTSAVTTAWQNTDVKARRAAIKAAYLAGRTTVKTARKDWKAGRDAAWKQFRTDRKACGATAADVANDTVQQSSDTLL